MNAADGSTTKAPTVAVLGLGAMGLPMASRLSSDSPVRAFDIHPERRAQAEERGATGCATAVEAVDGADVVVVAVRDRGQLDDLLWGAAGIAGALQPGAAIVLTSTIGVPDVEAVAARLAEETSTLLVDAPVSGGPARAGAGDLLVTVGATDEGWSRALPVLEALSGTLTRMGDAPGAGQAMKTVNQLLCGVHIAAAAEALALADALGLDPQAALDTLMAGAAASFMLGDRGPRALQAYDDGGAEVRSRLDIFVKDLGIVGTAARGAGLAAPVAAAAEQLFLLGQGQGKGADDDSSVITVLSPERRTDGPAS